MVPAYSVDFILRLLLRDIQHHLIFLASTNLGRDPRPDINRTDLWEVQRCLEAWTLECKPYSTPEGAWPASAASRSCVLALGSGFRYSAEGGLRLSEYRWLRAPSSTC